MNIAMSGGMNWTWFLAYSIDEEGFIIRHAEERFHSFDESQGAALERALCKLAKANYSIIEPHVSEYAFGDPRIAKGVEIDGQAYMFRESEPRFVYHSFDWQSLV